jgi:hypothetical protein
MVLASLGVWRFGGWFLIVYFGAFGGSKMLDVFRERATVIGSERNPIFGYFLA